jgi:N-acetyl-anhydromuramyl-L-alanine amidase AmpD
MLEIQSVDYLNSKELNIIKKNSKKNQILLYDTGRRTDYFINKIKYRNNNRYDEIPHFIVTKLGIIYQLYDTKYYSKTFDIKKIDKQFIKIAIENLGWLNKNTITGFLSNWIGDPYRTEPFVSKWRNYHFWDKYNDIQLEKISALCQNLCVEHNIPYNIVPSQGYMENVINFSGIVCKSNFSNIYTDINPSFNFKFFLDNENKQ